MINTVVDYFSRLLQSCRTISGQVNIKINLSDVREINFRVDAFRMRVDWGDGTDSGEKRTTELFCHEYAAPGAYQILIHGDNITDLDMPGCYITHLDVSQCVTLEYIDCSRNLLRELNVSNCKWLYELYCAKNQIREFKLGHCRKLFYLSCSCNHIKQLEVRGCPSLVHLRCRYNLLHYIDIRRNRKLVFVNIENNAFNFRELMDFLSMLAPRPETDIGFIVLQRNAESDTYDSNQVRDCLSLRGWREI